MDTKERQQFLTKLAESRDAVVDELAGVSEEQAKFRPAPDRWSIAEIVEHLAVAEHGMYRLITAYSEPLDTVSAPGREEAILNGTMFNRSNRLEAPERARPRGRYGSLGNSLQQFRTNRDRTMEYVRTCADDLRSRALDHVVGRITCQECLALLTVHPLRHIEQIREIQASAGYPR